MTASIGARGARGAGVTMLGQGLTMVLQLVGTVILARLLTPDDYGLLAMVTVLMGVGALIRDFGMGTAALQESTLTHAQASNLFWMNAALSGGTAVLLAASAPLVAAMFGDDRLNALVPVMAIVLLLTGLQTQYQMRLARDMRFIAMSVVGVSAVAVGIGAGVLAALAGWGYWALAVQQLAVATWTLGAMLLLTRWLPSPPSRGVGSRAHLRAGVEYGFANVLGYAADNIDTFVIGIQWGAAPLGNYNRAFQLFMQPISGVFGPLTRVVIPTINRMKAAGSDGHQLLLRVQSALVGLATWVLVSTAAVADWLIPLMLGDQWTAMVPLVQILAVGGVFKALSQINYWTYIVYKQPHQLLVSNLVTKPIQIVLVVMAAFFGVEWVAAAYSLGRLLSWPINLAWLGRTAAQPSRVALVNGVRIIVAAAVTFVSVRLVLGVLEMSSLAMVAIGLSVATVAFGVAFVTFPGGWTEVRQFSSLRKLRR